MRLENLEFFFEKTEQDAEFKESLLKESLIWITKRMFSMSKDMDTDNIQVEEFSELDDAQSAQAGLDLSLQQLPPSSVIPGNFYHFLYKPKHRNKLKYYDQFPLTLVLKRYDNGFLGLNFHYLDLEYRFALMSQLWSFVLKDEDGLDEDAYINIRYKTLETLKGKRFYKPCVKRYLYDQFKSPVYHIPANNWIYALMLPSERFFSKNNAKVINKLVHVESKLTIINS